MEVWKAIPGFEGKYEVSNFGEVRTLYFNKKILKQIRKYCTINYFYLFCVLLDNKKPIKKKIHRLVALAFLENPHEYECVLHLDNDTTNNKLENLMWGSKKMNAEQKVRDGRHVPMKGELHGLSKLTDKDVIEIKNKYIPRKYTLNKLAKEYNVSFSLIHKIVSNKSWKHINSYK